jgi:hypothetical protein
MMVCQKFCQFDHNLQNFAHLQIANKNFAYCNFSGVAGRALTAPIHKKRTAVQH